MKNLNNISPIELQNLLEDYANGRLSMMDRHQLEKQALDDDFLFEALEGYILAHKNAKKGQTPKVIIFSRFYRKMAVAASIFIGLAAAVYLYQLPSTDKNTLATTPVQKIPQTPDTETALTTITTTTEPLESNSPEISTTKKVKKRRTPPRIKTSDVEQKVETSIALTAPKSPAIAVANFSQVFVAGQYLSGLSKLKLKANSIPEMGHKKFAKTYKKSQLAKILGEIEYPGPVVIEFSNIPEDSFKLLSVYPEQLLYAEPAIRELIMQGAPWQSADPVSEIGFYLLFNE